MFNNYARQYFTKYIMVYWWLDNLKLDENIHPRSLTFDWRYVASRILVLSFTRAYMKLLTSELHFIKLFQ